MNNIKVGDSVKVTKTDLYKDYINVVGVI